MSTRILARLIFPSSKYCRASKMSLFQELRCVTTVILTAPSHQTYVMSRAVTEQIVLQSHRLVEFSVSKWLRLTQFQLFTPLFDWRKQLCNGKTYRKYEKQALRLSISTYVCFEIGSVYTIIASIQWKFLNFNGVLQRFPSITQCMF